MNNFVYLILTNVPDLVFTDFTEIFFFFKTRVYWFELSLAKTQFFH